MGNMNEIETKCGLKKFTDRKIESFHFIFFLFLTSTYSCHFSFQILFHVPFLPFVSFLKNVASSFFSYFSLSLPVLFFFITIIFHSVFPYTFYLCFLFFSFYDFVSNLLFPFFFQYGRHREKKICL